MDQPKKKSFIERLSQPLEKAAVVINDNRYVKVIKDSFIALTPIVITGAFGTLFSAMVFNDETGLASIKALHFLADLQPISSKLTAITLNFLTIYLVFLIGLELGKLNKIKGFSAGIVAVASYLALNPMTFDYIAKSGKKIVVDGALTQQYTDTTGLFLGMLAAILSVELYTWLGKQKSLGIKLPENVPSNVVGAFSSLIPTVMTVTLFSVICFIVTKLTNSSLNAMMYAAIQHPLERVVQGPAGILLLVVIANIFWLVGILGDNMVSPIREPLLLSAIAVNSSAYAAGKAIPNIITMPFWDMYLCMGGSGVTIGLLIAVFLVSKRPDWRQIAKISFAPGIFNINEPVIFGMPIVLNPMLAIPFVLVPVVTGIIGYVATYIGFAGKAVVMVPWPTPPLINGYLATAGSWGAVATQLICIIVSVLIYLPFVKISDKQYLSQNTKTVSD